MLDSLETQNLFTESEDKSRVYKSAFQKISEVFVNVKKFPVDEQPDRTIGGVFEAIAVFDNLDLHGEKPMQKSVREIIEKLLQNADILTENKWASKPDFISVVFDQNGNLIIKEIVEIKTSNIALQKKIERQPQGTIDTIVNIVELMNNIFEAKTVEELYSKTNFKGYSKKILTELYYNLQKLHLGKNTRVTFHENLKYRVIVPSGTSVDIPDNSLLLKNGSKTQDVSIVTSECKFTYEDCKQIIEHHIEQSSK